MSIRCVSGSRHNVDVERKELDQVEESDKAAIVSGMLQDLGALFRIR